MGHLRDENHLIDVHLAEMWAPNEDEEDRDNKDKEEEDNNNDDNKEEEDDNNNHFFGFVDNFFWIC